MYDSDGLVVGLMFLGTMMMMTLGGYLGRSLAPDNVERLQIEEVNIEEFSKIDEQLNLTGHVDNVEVDNEGKIVFVGDSKYDKTYRLVEGEGDIKSEEYLKNRKDYILEVKKRDIYTLAGVTLPIISIAIVANKAVEW